MIVFGLLILASTVAGTFIARVLWAKLDHEQFADTGPVERVTAGAVIAIAVWLSASWLLALTHTLTGAALWTIAGAIVIAAVAITIRAAPQLLSIKLEAKATRAVFVSVPVLLWTIFALWRGAILPPSSHDALSYHLPRALLMVRAHGFEHFPSSDPRLNSYPANFELLMADVLAMSRSDRLTEWIATAMFVLFLLATAALAARWWRETQSIGEVVLATAMTPLLLLHSSAHKNDVMAAAFAVTALVWGARWCTHGGRMPMILLVASLVIGGGTKPQVAAILIGLAPFLIARCARELRARRMRVRSIALTAVLAIGFFAICGGATYIALLTPASTASAGGTSAAGSTVSEAPFRWGDFGNLWQVPILLVTAPFSANENGVWIPWRHEYWFWPRYEIYFSNWGKLFSILALALPFCVFAFRRSGEETTRRERRITSIATLIAVLLILPFEIRPVGFFGALARYLLFVVPVVMVWTVAPLVDRIRGASPTVVRRIAPAAILIALFLLQAVEYGMLDRFAPMEYLLYAAEHPGTRVVWFDANRAASVVDRIAGPQDTIAVDSAFDTWIYPAYGARLTRNVVILPRDPKLSDIPPAAQWVIVDRSWNALWRHPKFTDMGKFWRYAERGQPTEADTRLYLQLLRDPRFRLIYRMRARNQAVFWRIDPTVARPPREWKGAR